MFFPYHLMNPISTCEAFPGAFLTLCTTMSDLPLINLPSVTVWSPTLRIAFTKSPFPRFILPHSRHCSDPGRQGVVRRRKGGKCALIGNVDVAGPVLIGELRVSQSKGVGAFKMATWKKDC